MILGAELGIFVGGSNGFERVQGGSHFLQILRTPNWTWGSVQPNSRTLNRTLGSVLDGSSSNHGSELNFSITSCGRGCCEPFGVGGVGGMYISGPWSDSIRWKCGGGPFYSANQPVIRKPGLGFWQPIGKMNYGIMVLFTCAAYGASPLFSALIFVERITDVWVRIPHAYHALSNIHVNAYKAGIFVHRTSGNPNSLDLAAVQN